MVQNDQAGVGMNERGLYGHVKESVDYSSGRKINGSTCGRAVRGCRAGTRRGG